jgi:hypothetical protein
MKIKAKDLKRLVLPGAVCVALAMGGVACHFAADGYLQDAKRRSVAVLAQRTEVQDKLNRANDEEREIRASLQQYRALEARGVTSEENRLDWVDVLTAIKNERRLFNISYTIDPQKELDYPGIGVGKGVYFIASRVRISAQLLHEGDLFNLLDDLAARSKLHLSVRNCGISRIARPSGGAVLAPRLQADCALDLITIRYKKLA